MAISRNIEVIIKEDKAELKEKLFVYKNDRNVDIMISIIEPKYKFNKELSLMRSLQNAYSNATVLKPNNTSFKTMKIPVFEDKIKFTITEDMVDELTEIGLYKVQFHLYDDNNARVTIPNVIFEVKELIADVSDNTEVSNAVVGKAIVDTDIVVLQVFEGRIYIKTQWRTGDIISAEKLNKIEDGIYKNAEDIANIELIPGPQGIQGNDGSDGLTPNITIGTVTTLEPDQNATVTRTGTVAEPIINFGIPKGQVGPPPDLTEYQKKADEALITKSKEIVGAINETNSHLAGNTNTLNNHIKNHPDGSGGIITKTLTNVEISEILGVIVEPPKDVEVEALIASSNYININKGETRKLTCTILPSHVTNKTLVYSSSDNLVATVDNYGNIVGISRGDILITITAHNGVKTDCQVVVNEVSQSVDVESITITPSSSKVGFNEVVHLTHSVLPASATNKSVSWVSTNESIATVNNGVVTTKEIEGSVNIECISVSNPNIKGVFSIAVAEVKALTTVKNGLVHSYDLAGLSGTSTNIDDLTGNISLTMVGFASVENSKTVNGVVADTTTARIIQGNMMNILTGKYSVVVYVKSPSIKNQGIWGTSNIKLCSHNNTTLMYTTTAYLDGSLHERTHSPTSFSTIISTFDFDSRSIKTYVDGYLVKTTPMDEKVIWSNSLNLFDGYSVTNNVGVCISKVLLYDRCITDTDAITITNDLSKGNRYLDVDFTKTTLTNNIGVIKHISTNSEYVNNTLKCLVSNSTLDYVNSNINGFTVGQKSPVTTNPSVNKTFIISFEYNSTTTGENYLYYNVSGEQRLYLTTDKVSIRSVSAWFLQNAVFNAKNGTNILFIEFDKVNKAYKVHINGTTLSIIRNDLGYITELFNTTVKIKEYIIYDRILNSTERQELIQEIGGTN